ncbi:MAG: ABC transporter ATP-binding protein [Nitrososphaerota archaeon]|jgi:putative ABC transport system ATP-binding protein|nr:ABC transporter ATP-binding protein [Nitrososphaerota archaeon]
MSNCAQNNAVETSSLTKEFNFQNTKITALNDATFKIATGEFVVVLGHSGSGKSTLLNLVGGLDKPSSGTIKVCGTDLSTLNDDSLSAFRSLNIGFIFQTYNLISTLTSLENIQFPMKLSNVVNDQLIKERARELLNLVGLANRCDHLPFQMSCGEQQRVAIARALANDPPLILADEPTGNLDWPTGKEVIMFLKQISKTQKKTMIVVTHDERIVELADATMRLEKGRIVNIARHV